MTNHVHLIISKTNTAKELPFIIGDLKKFTALKLINTIKGNPKESRKEWLLRARTSFLARPDQCLQGRVLADLTRLS